MHVVPGRQSSMSLEGVDIVGRGLKSLWNRWETCQIGRLSGHSGEYRSFGPIMD